MWMHFILSVADLELFFLCCRLRRRRQSAAASSEGEGGVAAEGEDVKQQEQLLEQVGEHTVLLYECVYIIYIYCTTRCRGSCRHSARYLRT